MMRHFGLYRETILDVCPDLVIVIIAEALSECAAEQVA